jgi:hypothetical protein
MEQINVIPAGVRILGINDAYLLAPKMDLHHACDGKWWGWHYEACRGRLKCDSTTISKNAALKYPDLKWVEGRPRPGLSYEATAIHTGKNSGYQAINIAVLMGAKKILLIGFDLKVSDDGRSHWFGDHPDLTRSFYETWHPQFQTLVDPLRELGVEVINCSPDSALECFPKANIEDVFR